MRLLVLGGTQFVGHAVVADAVARGWDVTVANRGLSDSPHDGVRTVTLDRTEPGAFDALAGDRFDLVADTWSGAPSVVRDAARALGEQVGRWVYISSRSVYAWPPPARTRARRSGTATPTRASPSTRATSAAASWRSSASSARTASRTCAPV